MRKRKRTGVVLALVPTVGLIGFLAWFLLSLFEGEKPQIQLSALPEFITGNQELNLAVHDSKRGLRSLEIVVNQEGRAMTVLRKEFIFKGLLNREGTRQFETVFSIEPKELKLAQGRVDLEIRVRDYSRRSGGDGNLSLIRHELTVDTIPPSIRAVSRMHNVNQGGACLIIYQASSDTIESGVFVNDVFFRGFKYDGDDLEGYGLCYFTIPWNWKGKAEVYLWASDRAKNHSRSSFYYHIRRKKFKKTKITIKDRFLKKIIPQFPAELFDPEDSTIQKFLKINQEVRSDNGLVLRSLKDKTTPSKLWDGKWLRLKNAATMSGFGEQRIYYYKGQKVDEQFHLGVDLASLANSEIQAANRGRVIFADYLGIYGNTVVMDHGHGLSSVYSHLSAIKVEGDQMVQKGDVIGISGQTGLAGGDHLHFGVLVNGIFVNPIEWWDAHWIQDNISRKLKLLKDVST
jgi:murein DD-endopeptidase MepM/ murein hydrolase activator NlpD